jgi:hypothetical protein
LPDEPEYYESIKEIEIMTDQVNIDVAAIERAAESLGL